MRWVDQQLEKSGLDDGAVLEFKLMFSCAQALIKNRTPVDPHCLADLASRHALDWSGFLDLLHANRLLPMALRALQIQGAGEPKPLMDALKRRCMQNTMHALKMTAELVRLTRLFSDNGIRVIAFKGPALSVQVYGDPTMRFCTDLDLLLAREDHERAERLLLQEGYDYLPGEIPCKAGLAHGRIFTHTHLVHREHQVHVELHFHLCHDASAPAFQFDDLWRERDTVSIANTEIPTLPLPLHGVYLAIHGESHSWERLIRLYDIAVMLDSMKPEDFTGLMALAERYGQKQRFMRTLLLAHLFFDIRIPDSSLGLLADHRVMTYMGLALQMTIAPWTGMEESWGHRYWLKKRVRWVACIAAREKWHYLLSHFLPQYDDITKVPLPEPVFFLHYLLRPLWVLQRKAKDMFTV
jgi:hypothetical protein